MTRRVTATEADMKRATRLPLIAEAGGCAQEVMAWGGHVTMSEADGYVRRANRRALLIGKDDVGKCGMVVEMCCGVPHLKVR